MRKILPLLDVVDSIRKSSSDIIVLGAIILLFSSLLLLTCSSSAALLDAFAQSGNEVVQAENGDRLNQALDNAKKIKRSSRGEDTKPLHCSTQRQDCSIYLCPPLNFDSTDLCE